MTRIAVLSDIHAVAPTYRAALAAARSEGFDVLVILGDLLTYGVDPAETLDLTRDAIDRDGALLILGNHDQIYLDERNGGSAYTASLPAWLRESVEWTWSHVGSSPFWQETVWHGEWLCGALLVSHANPYGAGNWTYLNTPEQMEEACAALAGRGLRWGVFGHTHRVRRHDGVDSEATVFTVGSLGQPREAPPVAQWAMVEVGDDRIAVSPRPVAYDWAAQVAAISATALSDTTKARLIRFFQ